MNYTEKAIEILDKFEQYTKGSLRDSGINNIMPLLKEALREKLEREKNPPLTLEELREMENQPVWINDNADISNTGWLVWSEEHNTGWFEPYTDGVYGSDWLAYRHKPDHFREGTNKLENDKSGEDNG